jgi:predicted metal-dependent phosphoesterase TrpH
MRADLHIHSTYSQDGITKPETVLEIAAERNIDIIAITDENSIQSWRAFKDAAAKYPVKVVFGQEIKLPNGKYSDGELLGLFLESPIKSKKTADVISEVAAQNGITSIARPFCERRGEFRAFDQIEDWSQVAIEVRNGRTFKRRDNQMAKEFAERLSLPATAGSDAHTPFEIGNVYIEFDGKNSSDLKKAILNRDVAIGGESSSAFFTLLSNIGRFGISV